MHEMWVMSSKPCANLMYCFWVEWQTADFRGWKTGHLFTQTGKWQADKIEGTMERLAGGQGGQGTVVLSARFFHLYFLLFGPWDIKMSSELLCCVHLWHGFG